MSDGTAPVKYVFMDVEGFTMSRSVEAQADIVATLNEIVLTGLRSLSVTDDRRILLPTGDGICVALLGMSDDLDIHLRLAITILQRLDQQNSLQQDAARRFKLRLGINQNIDNLITDINGRRNVAGAGVNIAQRVMSVADGNQIMMSAAVYDTLSDRERYAGAFRAHDVTVKHGVHIRVYQFIRPTDGINVELPSSFAEQFIDLLSESVPLFPLRWAFRVGVKNALKRRSTR